MMFDLHFYFVLFLRRLPYVLMIMAASTMVGVMVAFYVPPVYRAEARLLFENAEIPDELAASTVRSSANEALLSIQQRILTRANLLALAERFQIFADVEDIAPDVMVEAMRDSIFIYMPQPEGGTGVITVSFGASTPEISAGVTNAVAEDILEQSVELRTSASGNTLDFFEQEVRRLSDEMVAQNAKILEFEEANRDALPESLTYRRGRQATEQERLLQVDRELASLRDRRQRLSDLYDRTGRLATSVGDLTPEQAQLETVRQELASALVVLSPTNPRVRALQTQVAALEEAVKEQLDAAGGGTLSTFEVQMLDIDGQIEYLAEQKDLIEKTLDTIKASIEATPGNSMVLGILTSDYENLRVQYDQAVASLANARMGDRIEVTDRGQRISIIEPAVPPTFRSEPNRKLLAVGGFGVGVFLSGLLVLLLELLNRTIRRPSELVSALGITPFATIPYIESRADVRSRRMRLVWGSLGVAVVLPLLLLGIVVYVIPVDEVIAVLTEFFGLGVDVDPQLPSTSG
ncbi:MAG: lipopolysaccharide biosynthesis protein [Rhodobacter sp.]|nr:lipopolysaccharide biosynthesis protein [Rhodobacter sp.]